MTQEHMKSKIINIAIVIAIFFVSLLFFTQGDLNETGVGSSINPTTSLVNQPNYGNVAPENQSIADAAIGKLLNADLGFSPGDVSVLSVEKSDFSDSSLGCPEPGKSYAQVITAGYTVLLYASSQLFEYHTDALGETVVYCSSQ